MLRRELLERRLTVTVEVDAGRALGVVDLDLLGRRDVLQFGQLVRSDLAVEVDRVRPLRRRPERVVRVTAMADRQEAVPHELVAVPASAMRLQHAQFGHVPGVVVVDRELLGAAARREELLDVLRGLREGECAAEADHALVPDRQDDDAVLDVRIPDLVENLLFRVVLEVGGPAEGLLVGADESVPVALECCCVVVYSLVADQRTTSISLARTTRPSVISARMPLPVGWVIWLSPVTLATAMVPEPHDSS